MLSLSIVIPSYNKPELTINLIREIASGKIKSTNNSEIVVIDDGSNNTNKAKLNKFVTNFNRNDTKNKFELIYIDEKRNCGFASACNKGAKEAKKKFILFLNNDIEYARALIENILKLNEKKIQGILGANLFYPNGLAQHLGVTFSDDFYPFHFGAGGITKKEFLKFPRRIREFQAISAAFMLINRKDFLQLNGFDEKFKNGMEDIDFCLRYKKKYPLKKILIPSEYIAIHKEGQSPGREKHNSVNEDLFKKKWQSEFGAFIRPDWLDKVSELNLIKYYHRDKPSYFIYGGHKWGQFSWIRKKVIKMIKTRIKGMKK